jgi:ABC-type Fe3+/spermidine/putrescine transport system ATPase subunit
MGVKENIFYGLRYRKSDKGYIDAIFQLLGIEKLLSRDSVVNLSGGEARKVALARSLAVRPRLLLLDEPLAFLDPISQGMVTDSLRAINKNTGITVIHVTHTASEARQLGDSAAVLVNGEILQLGTPEEIIDRPRGIVVEKYWGKKGV